MKTKGKYIGFFLHLYLSRLLCEIVAGNWQMSQNQTEILRTWFPPEQYTRRTGSV